MIFRTTLSHDTLGSQVISEPDGWKNAKIKLERDPNGHSLVEHYEGAADGAFIFYGDNGQINGGIDFLRDAEALTGLDSEINFLHEVSFDGYTYEELFTGQVDISEKNEMQDNKLQAPVIRDDFWSKFISRMDTPVNLSSTTDLDGNAVSAVVPIDMYLPSQKINKKHSSGLLDSFVITEADWSLTDYIQVGANDVLLDELKEFFILPTAQNSDIPVWQFAMEEGGEYQFNLRIECSNIYYHCTGGSGIRIREVWTCNDKLNFYIQKNDEAAIGFDETNSFTAERSTAFTYTGTLSLVKGDIIRIYGDPVAAINDGDVSNFVIWSKTNEFTVRAPVYIAATCTPAFLEDEFINYGQSPQGSGLEYPTFFQITAKTAHPSTITQGYLLHDAFYGVLQRIGLGNTPFYSEFLGSTLTNSRQYIDDGCGWGYVLLKGLQVRQYSLTEKPFFTSFKQLWEGANPILNLSFAYSEVLGVQVITIEQKAEHYDTSDTSVNFSNVRNISCKYDQEYIFKTIKQGYKKWQSEDVSGIDDPQTKKTYATILKKAGKEITVESEFIAASLAIETTRRATREKSADHKFDNETFIIAINTNDVSPDSYGPELAENFDSITGLLNSDTRYNSTLTPARNFLRWANFYNGGLFQYQTSSYKFVAAEGNYDMVSDYSCSSGLECIGIICDPLSEKQDISLATYWAGLGYLFIPLEFTIKVPMEWEDYKTIRDNPKLGIGISQTTSNYITFFIKELSYEIVKGEATIKAWPRTLMTIQTIQNTTRMIDCE